MRIYLNILFASWFLGAGALWAAPSAVNQSAPNQAKDIPRSTPYAVVHKDANSSVWEQTVYESSPTGEVMTNKHSYTELATGLHYWSHGQWLDSSEHIDILPNGTAQAVQGPHKAYFPGDIYNGVIEVVTPESRHLKSRPMGLSYYDGKNNVLIAELKNSVGVVVGNNQVIYPDAFTDFKADLRYTYTKGGFEQDVILREQPPVPENFGLNSKNCVLEVLTEFFNTAEPVQTIVPTRRQGGVRDSALMFGRMKMMQGKAFAFDDSIHGKARSKNAMVYKSWQHMEGRTFLLEDVPVPSLAKQLDQLPMPANTTTMSSIDSVLHKVSERRLLPPTRLAQANTNMVHLARADVNYNSGLVLDYVTLNADTNAFTFRGDSTYLITGPVLLGDGSGTREIVFEGGAVIKFTEDASSGISLTSYQDANYKTGPYRPVIFTSKDDNSVGDTISGSTGEPAILSDPEITFLNGPVEFGASPASYLYFRYAGIGMFSSDPNAVDNCQFIHCGIGIYHQNDELDLHNVLFEDCGTAVGYGGYPGDPDFLLLSAENVTADSSWDFEADGGFSSYQFIFHNCLFTQLGDSALALVALGGTNDASYEQADASCYQSVGAANYYLTNGSPYRNAGTTNHYFFSLKDLKTKTTYPPILLSNVTVSVNTTLSPQAWRDTDAPDIGYHYDPIDYIVEYFGITNAVLTITNGAAIAYYNDFTGIWLQDGSSIVSIGSPLSPNWFVHYTAVQEEPVAIGSFSIASGQINPINPYHASALEPTGMFRFTKFVCLANDANHIYHYQDSWSYTNLLVQDCEFWGGSSYFGGYSNTVGTLKNNLFARSQFLTGSLSPSSSYLFLTNNLFWGASQIIFNTIHAPAWYAYDNAFDSCTNIAQGFHGLAGSGYNAYLNCSGQLTPTNTSDIVSSSALAYKTGPLGTFYQPTNSALINAGSTSADLLGLYHFTTQTNQMKETNSIVDIGYHYVAVDTNGIPIDTNGNGIPDYLDDANGNGLVDSGEIGWNIVGDLGLKVFITRPRSGSILP